MNKRPLLSAIIMLVFTACANSSEKPAHVATHTDTASSARPPQPVAPQPAHDSATFTGTVPVLCYHQIRDWTAKDSKTAKVYIVPEANFRDEIKMLHDSGYHTILPDQLMAYLDHHAPLPSKPVLLTFDDGDESQYTVALPELEKAGYKATFFVMTVSLGRPNYFSKDQVKELYTKGHTIGCHTWDHHMVTKYKDADWVKQMEKPTALLAQITGSPIKYFAYPFGLWNEPAVQRLKKYGFTAAFRLAGKSDHENPLFTIKRQIVDGNWNAGQLLKTVRRMEKE